MPRVSGNNYLRRQHGVITLVQARRAGLSDQQVRRKAASGHWERLVPGVYRLAGSSQTYAQRVMAACLAGGAGAVASHHSAARLLGVATSARRDDLVEITVARGRSTDAAAQLAGVVHHARHLDNRDRAHVDGIPVTKPARLLVDMAGYLDPPALDDLVDDVLWQYETAAPRSVLETLRRVQPRSGRARLRAALDPWLGGPRPESPPEMQLLRRLVRAGLPTPRRQFEILHPETHEFVARADLAYPDVRLAVEYDGARTHGPRQQREDARRDERIATAGWLALHARAEDTAHATCEPFVDRVRDELRRRR
jgi:hypothetical protein